MDLGEPRSHLPTLAAGLLLMTGAAAILLVIGLVLYPLPRPFGVALPASYRVLLIGLGLVGGGVHLLAARWAFQRGDLFRTAFATLVGMVLLQVSVPIDLIVLVCLGLARAEFESVQG